MAWLRTGATACRCASAVPVPSRYRPNIPGTVVVRLVGALSMCRRSLTTSSATKIYEIAKFVDLATPTKRFILRVHPDVVHSYGEEAVDTNQASLQEFFRLFEYMRVRCEAAEKGSPQPAGSRQLKPKYTFSFFYKSAGSSDTLSKVNRANADVMIPNLFEERTQTMASRGLHKQVQAQYLHLATGVLGQLLAAVGVAVKLELHSDLDSIIKQIAQSQPRKSNGSTNTELQGALGALHANLSNASPIAQGKGARRKAFSAEFESGAFSPKEKRQRALWLLGRETHVTPVSTLSRQQSREGMTRLLDFFILWHDALQLYDNIWDAVKINLGTSFFADVQSATVYIPYDADDEEYLAFFERHIPKMRTTLLKSFGSKVGRRI